MNPALRRVGAGALSHTNPKRKHAGRDNDMTQKAIGWTLGALLALLLGATMLGQMFCSTGANRNFTGEVEGALRQAGTGDWAGAERSADRAAQLWNQGNFLVAVKYAETDYTLLKPHADPLPCRHRQEGCAVRGKGGAFQPLPLQKHHLNRAATVRRIGMVMYWFTRCARWCWCSPSGLSG